jgi:hypothetical protein
MEEIEVPVEHLQEEIQHHATESHASQSTWNSIVALTSALLAVFAAVTALLSGHYANEAMLEQMRSSDVWSHYQAKSIKSLIVATRGEKSEEDTKKVEEYRAEMKELETEARHEEESSRHHLLLHETFARAVTLFQVAIGIAAVSVLTRKRPFFWVSIGFSAIGIAFMILGLLR